MPVPDQTRDFWDQRAVSVYPPGLLSQARRALWRIVEVDRRYDRVRAYVETRPRADRVDALDRRLEERRRRERQRHEAILACAHQRLTEAMLADLRSTH
jgi:hypothetical protein